LLHVFRFGEVLFHTGWFLESLAKQTLVLFVIRTAGRPWSNRPSTPLVATTLVVVAFGALLPYTPVAHALGFDPLPSPYFVFLMFVVGTYLAIVELVKQRVFQRLLPSSNEPGSPSSPFATTTRSGFAARAAAGHFAPVESNRSRCSRWSRTSSSARSVPHASASRRAGARWASSHRMWARSRLTSPSSSAFSPGIAIPSPAAGAGRSTRSGSRRSRS